jgi:hypothetical protein
MFPVEQCLSRACPAHERLGKAIWEVTEPLAEGALAELGPDAV